MGIYEKLMKARKKFHSSPIKKTGWNDFSKYDYFELSDFLIPAMDILAENDLIAVVSFETELATMTVVDVTSNETIVITSPMSTAQLKACQPVQSMGACQTFVRRYLYTTLFEIVEHDAIEAVTGKPEPVEPKPAPKKPVGKLATDAQHLLIADYIEAGQIPTRTHEWYKKNKDTLTEKKAKDLIDICKKEGEK